MSKFYSVPKLPRHVSDLISPSSGAFCTSCIRRLWYVVLLCVLLDTPAVTNVTAGVGPVNVDAGENISTV